MATMYGINILLVEDNEDDIMAITRAFKGLDFLSGMDVARDGQEALDYLTRAGRYASAKKPLPALILLDLNLPLVDGFAVLRRLKADENLKKIPVVVLTTSSREEDVERSYAAGAVSFITKPPSLREFIDKAREFEAYWTAVSRLPV